MLLLGVHFADLDLRTQNSELRTQYWRPQLFAVSLICGVQGFGPRLLQISRSMPHIVSTLVGHKQPANVSANTALTRVPPLEEVQLQKLFSIVTNRSAEQ